MLDSSAAGVPAVNIVVRTLDRGVLLRRALDDVLAQTMRDWHVTIVNDGGDANDVDQIVEQRALAFDGRVTTIHHERRRGMEAASNVGIRAVSSLYVAIHDDDDTWAPDFLERTTEWLAAHAESEAVGVRTQIVWEAIEGDVVSEIGREIFLPERRQISLFDLLRYNSAVPISMLYRRAALLEIGLFDETLQVTGDWDANLRLASRRAIGFIDGAPLAFWHQRPGQQGVLGNSVIALQSAHADYDRLVRDRLLREYVREEGLGLPLYLTRLLDERFDELRRTLDAGIARIDSGRPINVARRVRSRIARALRWRR